MSLSSALAEKGALISGKSAAVIKDKRRVHFVLLNSILGGLCLGSVDPFSLNLKRQTDPSNYFYTCVITQRLYVKKLGLLI